MHLSQAIHQAQTVGIHLKHPGDGDVAHLKLFWSLWTIDKILASMFGRPALIQDYDISLERPCRAFNSPNSPKSAFDIWFTISELLSDAILFYRPGSISEVQGERAFPSFDEIVVNSVQSLDFPTLGMWRPYSASIFLPILVDMKADTDRDFVTASG
jgi:hypothetical protein